MKTKLLAAFAIAALNSCLFGFAAETNYPVVIAWEKPVTNEIAADQVPPLVYRIKQATTVTNVVIVHEVGEKDLASGKAKRWTVTDDKAYPLSNKGGKIDMREWGVKTAIWHQLQGRFGGGTFRIALFEARNSGDGTKVDSGAQLSDWIELRMRIKD